jgi:hypothetical protein
MTVVSVDLAHRSYRDFGMVVLDDGPLGTRYELVLFAHNSPEAPTPEHVADFVIDVCKR